MVINYSQTTNNFILMDIYLLAPLNDMIGYISKYGVYTTIAFGSACHQVTIKSNEKAYVRFEAGGQQNQFC